MNPRFWHGRRVLLTGHTGFKGAWIAAILDRFGAAVSGIALEPPSEPNLWQGFAGRLGLRHQLGDVRDAALLGSLSRAARPEIILHLAAQSQVRRGYSDPVETFATNVLGTVHLLEAARTIDGVATVLVITSDKVYAENPGTGCDESSPLGGDDPYSASKVAADLATRSYAETYFEPRGVAVATARAGNVLGGGDFASDRLVPDTYRAARAGRPLVLRHPHAQRPWQHVLDCASGYLGYIEHLHAAGRAESPAINIGPSTDAMTTVARVAEVVGQRLGNQLPWQQGPSGPPAEADCVQLDCRLARALLGWQPRLTIEQTLEWTADWYAAFIAGGDPLRLVSEQIERYLQLASTAGVTA